MKINNYFLTFSNSTLTDQIRVNWFPFIWAHSQRQFSVTWEILDVDMEDGRQSWRLTATRYHAESIFYRLRTMIDHLRDISLQVLTDLLTTRATSALCSCLRLTSPWLRGKILYVKWVGGGIVSNFLKTITMIWWIIKKAVMNLYHIINYSPRVPFTMILVTGVIKLNTTLLEGRLDSTHKRPSCLLTGTHPSPRSVSVWRSVNRSDSL